MKKLQLTGKYGKDNFILIDNEDFKELCKFKWYAHVGLSNKIYAMTYLKHGNYPFKTTKYVVKSKYTKKDGTISTCTHIMFRTYLHWMVIKMPINSKKTTDHINGHSLDNRKINLRICDFKYNLKNKKLYKNNKSGYKGVSWNRHHNKWSADIRNEGKRIFLGYFERRIDAAKTYNKAALKYHGEFASINLGI